MYNAPTGGIFLLPQLPRGQAWSLRTLQISPASRIKSAQRHIYPSRSLMLPCPEHMQPCRQNRSKHLTQRGGYPLQTHAKEQAVLTVSVCSLQISYFSCGQSCKLNLEMRKKFYCFSSYNKCLPGPHRSFPHIGDPRDWCRVNHRSDSTLSKLQLDLNCLPSCTRLMLLLFYPADSVLLGTNHCPDLGLPCDSVLGCPAPVGSAHQPYPHFLSWHCTSP